MLMTHIPMDHLVALAEERRQRLLAEAAQDRLVRAVRRPSALRRLVHRFVGTGRPSGGAPPDPARLRSRRTGAAAEDHDLCG